MDKIMRMHSVTSTIENGFVYLPDKASWRSEYLHEIVTFPNGKYDDQVDSTSQALDWFKNSATNFTPGLIEWEKQEASKLLSKELSIKIPESMVCRNCSRVMSQLIPGVFRCMNCGAEWSLPGLQRIVQPNRTDTHYRRFAWRPRSQ